MFQIILTSIIVIAALGFGLYRTIQSLKNPTKGCEGCEKNCADCSLQELKKEIEKKAKQNE